MTTEHPERGRRHPAPSTSSRALAAVPPVAWALLARAAQVALAGRRPVAVPTGRAAKRRSSARIDAADVLAAVIGVGAGVFGAGAVAGFVRQRTTVNPHAPDRSTSLVTTGVLRRTRNPMYVALAGGLTAGAVWTRTPAAFVPVAAFVAVIDRGQIPVEEAALARRFGAEYAAYRARVPRWL